MDNFQSQKTVLDSPAQFGFDITPDDNNDLSNFTRAIWVGHGGNIKVQMVGSVYSYQQDGGGGAVTGAVTGRTGNTNITLINVQDGQLLPLRIKRIFANNTTANSMVGFY